MFPIIDSHCHVYPDKIAKKASQGIGNFYNQPILCDGTVKMLLEEGEKAGISHYIITSVATTVHQVNSINNFISETVKSDPKRFTGLGTLHPDSENLESDIENIINLGLKGVKLHPDVQGFRLDDERCFKICELCSGKLPILFHTGDKRFDYSNPNRLIPLLEKFSDLTIIAAHFGGWSIWEEACEKLSKYKNVYVDTSSSMAFLEDEIITKLIRKYGADRVLFGVDYPMWKHTDEVQRIMSLKLSEEEKNKILYKNAANLFNIKI